MVDALENRCVTQKEPFLLALDPLGDGVRSVNVRALREQRRHGEIEFEGLCDLENGS